ncbi:MAG: imidazolonepropionase [Flavobacteriales bacterium]
MRLFIGIKNLIQIRESSEVIVKGSDMAILPAIENAWLSVRNGSIEDFGDSSSLDMTRFSGYEVTDLKGKSILPCWVDSHTHLVFADWREDEFVDRILGMTYEQIAQRGGGILNSANKMRDEDEDVLFQNAILRLNKLISLGTGAIEIKSGYGLSLDSELKMLRVIKRIKDATPIPVKASFLAAHAIPIEFKGRSDDYVSHIIHDMLPRVEEEGLADYIDVFCETGYFTTEQTEKLLVAGNEHGLRGKVHVNQFNQIGGIQACVKHNALSVDHLEVLDQVEIESLESSTTIPVALPLCSLFLGIPYTPARTMIDAGLPLAIASDFNPGSTPSGNMNLAVSLRCIKWDFGRKNLSMPPR